LPNYTFINTETEEQVTTHMTLAERETFLEQNPHMKQTLATPGFADPVRLGVRRIDQSFNDVLLKAKLAHKHSTINTL
jgi:hypothetical protein